jgi:uncharacterized protein
MRILMAGASGFLGVPLVQRLREAGHEITRLVRRPVEAPDEATWTPSQGQLDPGLVAAADAVINLAGAGVGDKRWTAAYRSLIRSSRVDTTGTIARAIKHLPAADRPHTLLQGSAEGWYGETGDRRVTEESPAGRGFLADVVRVWEAAARPAEDAGTRVVLLRSGLPLHQDGGLLKPQMPIFRAGLGGRLGNGKQYLPWLSREDWLRAVEFLLEHDEISGPVNVVGPEPVTNAEFAETLGRVLHRPAVTFVPGFALQVALGGFAEEALGSKRVMPGVLSKAGFQWNHPTLESALRVAVGKAPSAAS